MTNISEKVEFPNRTGHKLAARLEMPVGPTRAFAIFAHCFTCSKNVSAASRISRKLSTHGIAVLRFDFTGLGNSEGDFSNTNFSSNVEDLVSAADFLRKQYSAPSLLIGHSLGGAAVLVASAQISEVIAVATIGAPSSPEHVKHLLRDHIEEIETKGSTEVTIGQRSFRIKKQFLEDISSQSLQKAVAETSAALLVMHSPIDKVVSIDHAKTIYEMAKHPKSFISLDHADHLVSNRDDAEFVANLLEVWLSRFIKKEQTASVPPVSSQDSQDEVIVSSVGNGFQHTVQMGRHFLTVDEPKTVGGTDMGPNPYALLLAALGSCTAMTLRMYADRKKWSLDQVTVYLRHTKIHAKDCRSCETQSGKMDRIERTIKVQGNLDKEQIKRLGEIADRCPVHRTLTTENEIQTTIDMNQTS